MNLFARMNILRDGASIPGDLSTRVWGLGFRTLACDSIPGEFCDHTHAPKEDKAEGGNKTIQVRTRTHAHTHTRR